MKQIRHWTLFQKLWLCIGGVFLPLFSLYLSSKASMFYENLTYVGNLESNRYLFMIWGIVQSLYYLLSYYISATTLHVYNRKLFIVSIIITVISIVAFLLPYQNHSGDIISQLHVYGSMLSCIATFILIIIMLSTLSYYDYVIFEKAKKLILLILSGFAFCILLFGDISTLSELILLNGLNYFFIFLISYQKSTT